MSHVDPGPDEPSLRSGQGGDQLHWPPAASLEVDQPGASRATFSRVPRVPGLHRDRARRRGWAPFALAVLVAAGIAAPVVANWGQSVGVISTQGHFPRVRDNQLRAIAAFVSRQRGLPWKHPVTVTFLSPSRFDKAVGGGDDIGTGGCPGLRTNRWWRPLELSEWCQGTSTWVA